MNEEIYLLTVGFILVVFLTYILIFGRMIYAARKERDQYRAMLHVQTAKLKILAKAYEKRFIIQDVLDVDVLERKQ